MKEAINKRPYHRYGGPHRNRSVSLPELYWSFLGEIANNQHETINRVIRTAVEAAYPNIKQQGQSDQKAAA